MGFGDSALTIRGRVAVEAFCEGGYAIESEPSWDAITILFGVARSLGDDGQLAETDRGGVSTIEDCLGREVEEADNDDPGDCDGG